MKTAAAFALGLGLLLPGATGMAQSTTESPTWPAWLAEFKTEAAAAGIDQAILDRAFAGVEPVKRIVERDRHQGEFKLTFADYLDRVVKPQVIARGRELGRRHGDLLRRVADKYGVQPRFILAIWGIETRFGRVRGTMPVIPALATLAWDMRRSKFFRNELMSALQMLQHGYIELADMTGSWAGAMGQPQFIPSSYMAYAQDFDGDGHRDIWRNQGDVFASIANYLARQGWSDDQTWGREVRLPAGFAATVATLGRKPGSGCRAIDAMTADKPLSAWQAMGVRRDDGRDLPSRDLAAALVQPDGAGGRSFLVYRNYQSILRYNCAHLYGLTVGILADRIGAG